MDQDAPLHV